MPKPRIALVIEDLGCGPRVSGVMLDGQLLRGVRSVQINIDHTGLARVRLDFVPGGWITTDREIAAAVELFQEGSLLEAGPATLDLQGVLAITDEE